ncbi:putative histidine kinase [Candidatus Kuenenia stuttgartiensis]|uniref:histidine kinase n=1 Tax=Kuenenia stuttgartiensis TaxID=174633 RepID=A0A6G7GSE6_KUEST|nr:PAS domain S-box protein [Candidatus Kuenenia stuttgartiensis]MCF6152173.1 PAS domain S-box protein [Candidatus Kuenenia stuttgartiensis]QII12243.1 putative histidine kinase [Candidatus Kuenenia stuttgartiensis]
MKLGAKYILSISLFVPLVLGVSFTLIIKRQDYLLEDEIKKHANILVKQIEMIHSRLAEAQNSFNTGRAGSNTVFIHLHPSEICAEFSNTINENRPYTVRLIALKHINTDNHPDDLEEAVLKNMEEQKPHDAYCGESFGINNEKIFRYIAPLYMKKSCLGCHGGHAGKTTIPGHENEAYKEGNLWGAISVIAPLRLIHASVKSNIIILICIALVSVAAIVFVTYLLTKRLITSPISKISRVMAAIADGDLDKRIHLSSGGEIGMLATSINKMTEDMQKTTVSKAYVENLIESMIDTLVVVDQHGRIKTVNKSMLDLLGYEEKELIGNNIDMILRDKDNPIANRSWSDLWKEDVLKDYDIMYHTHKGEDIPVNFCGRIMRNSDGEVINVVGVARDMRHTKKLINELSDFREATLYMLNDLEKARAELEREEKKLDMIVTGIGAYLCLIDREMKITWGNKPFVEQFGMVYGFKNDACNKIFGCGNASTEDCTAKRVFMSGKREEIKKLVIGRDNEKKYYHFIGSPIKDVQGNITHVLELVQDITKMWEMEHQKEIIYNINKIVSSDLMSDMLFRSISNELKRVMEFDRVSIALIDEKKQNVEVAAMDKSYDYTAISENDWLRKEGSLLEQVTFTGRPFIVRDTSKSAFEPDRLLLKEGIMSRLSFPLEYKGNIIGTINFGSSKKNSFSEKHFTLLKQIAIQLAIAMENARLFKKTRESEKRYKDLYDNAPDIYITNDENGIIINCNKTGAEILGYKKEELIGRHIFDFQTKKNREVMKKLLPKRLSGQLVKGPELQLIKKDGCIIDVSLNDNHICDDNGRITAIRSVYRDITAEKSLESQLLEAEKLASTGRVVSSVAHEINNPLEGIINYLQLLLERMGEKDEKRKYVELVMDGIYRIAGIVRSLLDSNLHIMEEKGDHNINYHIQNVVNLLQKKLSQSKITVKQTIDKNIPCIRCHSNQLEQVFTNLILNSLDAMPNGGTINITAQAKNNQLQIEFADNGCGIREKDLPNIFEPFFSTKKGTGTGLGLWICYNIITEHAGKIGIKSTLNEGTTFQILLPILKTDA